MDSYPSRHTSSPALLPTLRTREAILRHHLPSSILGPESNLLFLARITSGLHEQALITLCNRVVAIATTVDQRITDVCFLESLEQMLLGGGTTLIFLDAEERRQVAYHKVGHLLLDILKPVEIVQMPVTLFSQTLSLTQMRDAIQGPTSLAERVDYLDILLAGAAAERLEFEELSLLAESDLAEATTLARRLLQQSNATPAIDDVRFLGQRQQVITSILLDTRDLLEELVEELVEEEIIEAARLPTLNQG